MISEHACLWVIQSNNVVLICENEYEVAQIEKRYHCFFNQLECVTNYLGVKHCRFLNFAEHIESQTTLWD